MTSTRFKARPASRWMGVLSVVLAAAPGLAHAQPADLYFERTVMTVADERCGLFTPGVSAALAAGKAQARGAALRAGASQDLLKQVERGARAKASRLDCDSPQVLKEAERVKTAFAGLQN